MDRYDALIDELSNLPGVFAFIARFVPDAEGFALSSLVRSVPTAAALQYIEAILTRLAKILQELNGANVILGLAPGLADDIRTAAAALLASLDKAVSEVPSDPLAAMQAVLSAKEASK